ncbi:FtsX-like permease family protein [Gordonia sp. (in: high G+C Gram-positive bacteria)]|uniref:FtsX-like permease family protein n=1 Tax=Gordonia sp. (in: high G+C Gram-positive bacteria) TaxID=84139 RepID=UPI00263926C7|nr:FtsX-like permease family protein [Gordonia sp. (in: high G+C Gram-positive bacteria)]HMS75315.1 FtsX-like permease family protein [Gordonia sp. (in: high G+C Gram-positive bacteria)]
MISSLLAGLTRIRLINLRELRTHRLRVLTSLSVVVVSSALLIAVLGTYGSMTESVRQFNSAISGAAKLEVTAIGDAGLDAAIAGQIRGEVPGAKAVVPMIRGTARIGSGTTETDLEKPDKTVPLLGSDFRVSSLSGDLRKAMDQNENQKEETQSRFSTEQLASGVIAGPGTGLVKDQKTTINGIPVTVLDVAGGDALNGGGFVFAYLNLAQRLTAKVGRLDSILIVPRDGVPTAQLRSEINRIVDGRAVVVDPAFRAKQMETATSVTRDATLLVSLISLVIAAFLVFNTMNMAVASRRQSMAMLRALGAKRGHLVIDLLGESAVYGLVGGLIGVPLGILGGRAAVSAGSGESHGGMVTQYHLPVSAPVIAVLACVVACVAATMLAARSVFAVSPVEAMSQGEVAESAAPRSILRQVAGVTGIGVIAGSFAVALQVPGRPAIIAGAVYAVGVLLLCFALTGPLVWLVVRCARLFSGPGQLAAVNTERAPRRAWATLMTVAVAIAVGMGTSGALANMVSSMSDSLDGLADPDFYVASQPLGQLPTDPLLSPVIAKQIRKVPGVDEVTDGQWATVNVGEARIIVQGLTAGSLAPFMKKAPADARRDMLAGKGMVFSKVLARTLDVGTGDRVRLATPTGYRETTVLATVDYVSLDSGTAAMSLDLLRKWFDRDGATYLQVTLKPGADAEQVRTELERIAEQNPSASGEPVDVHSGTQAIESSKQIVEQSGAFTVAIQWIVSGAAAIALLNTLLLSVIERRRELGVLRAMGASRRFISRMVLAEAAAVAIVGSVAGLLFGGVLHWLADKILSATTSVGVEYSPQPSTLLFVTIAMALCLLGALVPAMRAARLNISESIAQE